MLFQHHGIALPPHRSAQSLGLESGSYGHLPDLPEELYHTDTIVKVADSKIGWAKAYKEFMSLLYSGQIPQWDVSNVRPHGARLKTFGGRASGPDPLEDLFQFTSNIFFDAVAKGQKKLVSIDCHDLMCNIAEVVVVGGVRRSALISLSNLSDERMRNAKSGAWWEDSNVTTITNGTTASSDNSDGDSGAIYVYKRSSKNVFGRICVQIYDCIKMLKCLTHLLKS